MVTTFGTRFGDTQFKQMTVAAALFLVASVLVTCYSVTERVLVSARSVFYTLYCKLIRSDLIVEAPKVEMAFSKSFRSFTRPPWISRLAYRQSAGYSFGRGLVGDIAIQNDTNWKLTSRQAGSPFCFIVLPGSEKRTFATRIPNPRLNRQTPLATSVDWAVCHLSSSHQSPFSALCFCRLACARPIATASEPTLPRVLRPAWQLFSDASRRSDPIWPRPGFSRTCCLPGPWFSLRWPGL